MFPLEEAYWYLYEDIIHDLIIYYRQKHNPRGGSPFHQATTSIKMIIFYLPDRQAARTSGKHPVQNPLIIHTRYGSLPNKSRQASDIWPMDLQLIRAGTVLHGRLHERSPEFDPHDAVRITRNAGRSSELYGS